MGAKDGKHLFKMCVKCGITKHLRAFNFQHILNTDKEKPTCRECTGEAQLARQTKEQERQQKASLSKRKMPVCICKVCGEGKHPKQIVSKTKTCKDCWVITGKELPTKIKHEDKQDDAKQEKNALKEGVEKELERDKERNIFDSSLPEKQKEYTYKFDSYILTLSEGTKVFYDIETKMYVLSHIKGKKWITKKSSNALYNNEEYIVFEISPALEFILSRYLQLFIVIGGNRDKEINNIINKILSAEQRVYDAVKNMLTAPTAQ